MLAVYLGDSVAPVQIWNCWGCKVEHPEVRNSRMKVASWQNLGILPCVPAFVQTHFLCYPFHRTLAAQRGQVPRRSSHSLFSFRLLIGVKSNTWVWALSNNKCIMIDLPAEKKNSLKTKAWEFLVFASGWETLILGPWLYCYGADFPANKFLLTKCF